MTENKHLFESTRSAIESSHRLSFQGVLALGEAIYMQLLV
jgi:hypothetical protein